MPNYNGIYERSDKNIQEHIRSAHAPSNAQKNSDITKAEIEAKLTGQISTHSHPASFQHPVGHIEITTNPDNPATYFGYGTWVTFGAGKVLVGLDPGDTDFNTVEETGGAKTVQSSAQSFSGNALATHQHAAITAGTPAGTIGAIAATQTAAGKVGTSTANLAQNSHTHPAPAFTGTPMGTHQHAAITAGTPSGTNTPGAATSIIQPYIVCYFWKRTA